ncbi:MAG TPA: hypothetical protein VD866_32590 [Urbifossiella sp.]|nr:hypothetical protein [Urbifossiella sp.]
MTRTGVAVVAFVVAGAAVAQPSRPPAPAGALLVTRLPAHLADPAIVDELKLTPEQVKALAPRGARKGAPTEDVPASVGTRVKDTLTPEQYARAVQLMAQDALRAGRGGRVTPAALVAVPASAFRRYPELADAANLTRTQRRRVTTTGPTQPNPNFGGPQLSDALYGGLPAAAHVLLEPEQTAALAAFVGPLRATPFAPTAPVVSNDVRYNRGIPGGSGAPWQRAMTALNNRAELKLTDAQVTSLTAIMNSARGIVRPSADGSVPTAPKQQTPAETEAALAKALDRGQLTRVKQIELWQQLPPGGDATAKFDLPRVNSEIGLSNDQLDALKAVAAAHRDKAAAALRSAASAEELKAALAAARAEVAAGVEGLLTAEQRTSMGELFGAEYRGGGGGGMDNDFGRRMRVASYGHYLFEIMLVNRFGGVAEDLRLTEEQKASFTAAETAYNQQTRQGGGLNYESPADELAKQAAVQSKAMQKVFDDNLNPEQRKRFRQLCIQCRQSLNSQQMGGNNMYPATGVPGVADDLKLTPEQRKRIIDTGDEDGTLTAAQRAEFKRLTGPPMAGGFDFGFGGRGGGRPAPPSVRLALLYAGAAHADLRLTAEQTHLIAETIEVHAAELRPATAGRTGEFGGYVEPPQAEAVADTVAACEKACHSVLTTAQRDRLGQLVLQAAADASLTAVFARPEVSDKLAFTAEQRAALDDIASDFRARVAAVNGLPTTAGWPEMRRQALADARATARTRMTAVLTPPQAAAWRGLTGAACPAVAALPPTGDDTREP